MRDFNKPLRKAVYELLNGNLSYNGNVPVYDQKAKKGEEPKNLVLISTISSNDSPTTFSSWGRDMDIVIDIVTLTNDSASTNIADAIAGQILALWMPTVTTNGLTQANFEYLNCRLSTDRYLDAMLTQTSFKVRRLLTFSITVNQIS